MPKDAKPASGVWGSSGRGLAVLVIGVIARNYRWREECGRVQILLSAGLQVAYRERTTRGAGAARRARVREREGAVVPGSALLLLRLLLSAVLATVGWRFGWEGVAAVLLAVVATILWLKSRHVPDDDGEDR